LYWNEIVDFHFKSIPMRKCFLLILCSLTIFVSFSNEKVKENKRDYAQIFNQLICQLNYHPDNQKTKKRIQEIYFQAIDYYQSEIDRILMSNNSLRWTEALDMMQQVNGLSEEIFYNTAVSQLICDPKVFTYEIDDAKKRAVTELYDFGTELLAQNTKEKAKEAYLCYSKAGKLNSDYKDVALKIKEAKDRATWKVLIEPISAHTQNDGFSFSTNTLYSTLFIKLREMFLPDGFINFYSQEESKRQKIENPDQIIQVEILNFEMIPHRYLAKKIITQPSKILKIVNGKGVWTNVEQPVISAPGLQEHEHEYTRLDMKSSVVINVNSWLENKSIYKYRMTWNYFEELGYSNFSLINQTNVSISPDNQIFFDHFSLSLCDQLVLHLGDFFKKYNY
jgi:hypothetical protein